MNNTLSTPLISNKLAALHQLASSQHTANPASQQLSSTERFMAVSAEQGQFLNFIVGLTKAKQIVEFGCSFGISGIYLAAAAKDNGGKVITTELEESKANRAKENFIASGLENYIEVRTGDALQTLSDIEKIDFLFLDGAKELYLPVYRLLYPKLTHGAVVIADNIDKPATHDLVNELQSSAEFRTTVLFEGRMLGAYR